MYELLRIFTLLSLIPFLTALILFARYVYYFAIGQGSGHVQSVIIASGLILIAFQVFLLGLLADLIAKNRRLSEEIHYRVRTALTSPHQSSARTKSDPNRWTARKIEAGLPGGGPSSSRTLEGTRLLRTMGHHLWRVRSSDGRCASPDSVTFQSPAIKGHGLKFAIALGSPSLWRGSSQPRRSRLMDETTPAPWATPGCVPHLHHDGPCQRRRRRHVLLSVLHSGRYNSAGLEPNFFTERSSRPLC